MEKKVKDFYNALLGIIFFGVMLWIDIDLYNRSSTSVFPWPLPFTPIAIDILFIAVGVGGLTVRGYQIAQFIRQQCRIPSAVKK